jgi:hypothetical protein
MHRFLKKNTFNVKLIPKEYARILKQKADLGKKLFTICPFPKMEDAIVPHVTFQNYSQTEKNKPIFPNYLPRNTPTLTYALQNSILGYETT